MHAHTQTFSRTHKISPAASIGRQQSDWAGGVSHHTRTQLHLYGRRRTQVERDVCGGLCAALHQFAQAYSIHFAILLKSHRQRSRTSASTFA